MLHIPTNTIIYIDAVGSKETRTIMRAELVAIHTALKTFVTHNLIGIFTDSVSSLQAIRHYHITSGTTSAKHYHHHRLLLGSATGLLETRRLGGLLITLHKIRAHTNIRGNDIAL
jgi:ribonuclease HI